ncbi:MAG: hypothetical protein KGS61_04730 [Verrucomicrobia bacterium]|nr:hypothetical protein [Verrucomicrobiota bacterium]
MSEPARERLSVNLSAEAVGRHAVAGFDGDFRRGWADIVGYLRNNTIPVCPAGGTY